MPQKHAEQHGTFHITTNTNRKIPWCSLPGVPEILIDNLFMTRNLQEAIILAFCILTNHMHIIVSPGEKGLSTFMQSFKGNSSRDAHLLLSGRATRSSDPRVAATECEDAIDHFSGWQKGYYDELIRDEKQLEQALTYVQENALKHDLVEHSEDWPWTSLHYSEKLHVPAL